MYWHLVISVQQQTPDNDFCHFCISNVRFAFWSFFRKKRKNSGLTPDQNGDPVTRKWKMTQMTHWPGDPMTQFHIWGWSNRFITSAAAQAYTWVGVTSQNLWSQYDRHFGYNSAYCMELKGDDLWSYSHKIEPVSLWKCPYDYQLANKAYLSDVTVTHISESFTYKMAAKTS